MRSRAAISAEFPYESRHIEVHGSRMRYVDGFIEAPGLERITLVVHDRGSGLGFYYARRHEQNVRAIAFMEAIIRWIDSLD